MIKIGELLDTGWSTAYSDGIGREGHTASASVAFSRRLPHPPDPIHQYLGNTATVADAERAGISLSLSNLQDDHTILLLRDSLATAQTVTNLCRGQPPRSGIERLIKQHLATRTSRSQDTAIAWVRSHISIPGNEQADKLATWSSHLGQTASATRIVTEGGLIAAGKAERATARRRPGYRLCTATSWSRTALSAYTWMRTEKGPQRQWLHHIGKAEDPHCPCNHDTVQSGLHITFSCPTHAPTRNRLLGNKRSWEDLDLPHSQDRG